MSGWRRGPNTLWRELAFRDYDEAKEFADYIAEHVDDYHRHPDVAITRNRVRVVIENLHHAGITLAEQRLAAKVDAALAERHPHVT
jgi:pterin-4a-carbinolamine dehydratase